MGVKTRCPYCEREISHWRFTAYRHAHKWTAEDHERNFPGKPLIDLWCPGGQGTARG